MNTTAKIQHKGQVTVPTSVRRLAGLSKGDLVNFAFQRGKIIITPSVAIDRSQFPTADDEYTPAQRRAIGRGIAQSEKEYKQSKGFGPFDSHAEFIASLHTETKKLGRKKEGSVAESMGRIVGEKATPGGRIRKRDRSEGHASVGLGDSVPEPLGFIAFTPECLF